MPMRSFPMAIGAPLVGGFLPPPEGTPEGDFFRWLTARRGAVEDVMSCLWHRWTPIACFVEVNFEHPEFGPAGAIVMTVGEAPRPATYQRARRIMAIPLVELRDYITAWEAGEALVIPTDTMPEPLRRRYAASPIRWSLNVPLHYEGCWVGLIGAGLRETPSPTMVRAFQASAVLIMSESLADRALAGFRALVATARALTAISPKMPALATD